MAKEEKQFKAAVISLGSKSSKWTVEEMEKYFETVDHLNIKQIEVNLGDKEPILYEGEPIKKYDCIYAKGSFRYNNLLRAITSVLNKETYLPLSPFSFTVGHDKVLTHLDLQRYNIPTPKTYLTATPEAAKQTLEKINYPIIMKLPSGTHGKGVMFADSLPSATSMLDTLAALKQPFLIQEFIDTDGSDIRAIVVGDKVVAGMKRKAIKGEKRANIHAGGTGESITPDYQTCKIAVEAAKALGMDVCAVDILESIKGPLVLELNLSPGLQGITKASGINVANEIARFLFRKTKEFKAGKKPKVSAKQILDDMDFSAVKNGKKELITSIDLRGKRMLLPEVITDMTGFDDKMDLIIHAEKDKLEIKKFKVGEK
tara:strand:+ start:338 stop:1453 length:1116 start_codon:yes stop_codon:yes gene_type:complete